MILTKVNWMDSHLIASFKKLQINLNFKNVLTFDS